MVMKRVVDIVASLGGLVLLLPLFLIVAVTIKINSRGPVFFAQERIGKGFRPFWIYKFRTMVKDAAQRGGALTASGDPRKCVNPLKLQNRRYKSCGIFVARTI